MSELPPMKNTTPENPLPSSSMLSEDIAAFLHFMEWERGASRNTLDAYANDLRGYQAWVEIGGVGNYLAPTLNELTNYLGTLYAAGLAPSSVSRKITAIKGFYKFLVLEERTKDETASLLVTPKVWERLPKVLGAVKCDMLVEAPQEYPFTGRG